MSNTVSQGNAYHLVAHIYPAKTPIMCPNFFLTRPLAPMSIHHQVLLAFLPKYISGISLVLLIFTDLIQDQATNAILLICFFF